MLHAEILDLATGDRLQELKSDSAETVLKWLQYQIPSMPVVTEPEILKGFAKDVDEVYKVKVTASTDVVVDVVAETVTESAGESEETEEKTTRRKRSAE